MAVGSGFAALETMGYAFVTLLDARGHVEPVAQLLLFRATGSLGGHAAWTGLACAALFAVRGARHRWWGRLRFLCVLAGVVTLHAGWDRSTGGQGYLAVGAISFVLLMAVAWWLQFLSRHPRSPRTGAGSVEVRTPALTTAEAPRSRAVA